MNKDTVQNHPTENNAAVNHLMPRGLTEDLKLKVNTLLWEELPANTTICQAEEMACEIVLMILNQEKDNA